jgi:hypothetical protein
MMYVLEAPAASLLNLRVEMIGNNVIDYTQSQITVLRLDAFEEYEYDQDSPDSALGGSVDTYATKSSLNYTFDDRGEALWMSWSNVDNLNTDSTGITNKILVNSVAEHDPDQSGGGPDYAHAWSGTGGGETSRINWFMADKVNNLSGTKSFELQIATDNTSNVLKQYCMVVIGTRLKDEDPSVQRVRARVLRQLNDVIERSGTNPNAYQDGGAQWMNGAANEADETVVDIRDLTGGRTHLLIGHCHGSIIPPTAGGWNQIENYFGDLNGAVEDTEFQFRVRPDTFSDPLAATPNAWFKKVTPTDKDYIARMRSEKHTDTGYMHYSGYLAIELDDLTEIPDSVSDGDWGYVEDTATGTTPIPVSFDDRAEITITPNAGDTYLIMGFAIGRHVPGADARMDVQLYNSTDAEDYGQARRGNSGGTSNSYYSQLVMTSQVFPDNTQRTFKVRVRDTYNVFEHRHSAIFILRLNAFKEFAAKTSASGGDISSGSEEQRDTVNFDPDGNDEAVCLGWCAARAQGPGALFRSHLDYGATRVADVFNENTDLNTPDSGAAGQDGPDTQDREFIFNTALLGEKATLVQDDLDLTVEVHGSVDPMTFYESTIVAFTTRLSNPPPDQATTPDPTDTETSVSVTKVLGWSAPVAGGPLDDYDVYFGTNETAVDTATTLDPEFKGNQPGTTYNPGTMNSLTTYYWRIDTVGDGGTTKGVVWEFTTEVLLDAPIVTNITPTPGSVGGVEDPVRFSLRDYAEAVDKDTISVYIGSGPVFYEGDELPENLPEKRIIFKALSGEPDNPATRTIDGGGELLIEKDQASQNQEAIYEMGGLNAPADPDDPIMVEFTLELDRNDMVVDGNDFTGVLVGMKINDSGLTIKFFTDGVAQWIEIHDAAFATVAAPSPTYETTYDWQPVIGTPEPFIYKLLWHPKLDIVRLYVSRGLDSQLPDELLVDGAVSDFSTIPVGERPANQPVAFFGHGYATPTSISKWSSVYLHNIVDTPMSAGAVRGEQVGFLVTNETTYYFPEDLPAKSPVPWLELPSSFAPVGTGIALESGSLILDRRLDTESVGIFRYEPKVGLGVTMLDFRLAGRLDSIDAASQAPGMEVFLDDGTSEVRVGLLSNLGVEYLGVLRGSPATDLSSYIYGSREWTANRYYRLIHDPSGYVRLFEVIQTDEGPDEELVFSMLSSSLPTSPALFSYSVLGFRHNALVGDATGRMTIGRIRYNTDVRLLWGDVNPPAPYTVTGTGTAVTDGTVVVVDDTSDSDTLLVERAEADFGATNGFFIETRCKVVSYEVDGETDPIRSLTGVGLFLDDGGNQLVMAFAEAGPPNNKIVFLSTQADLEQNLLDIRAGEEDVAGTYFSIDWTEYHIYRLERTIGGQLRLYIDDSDTPVVDIASADFSYAPTDGTERIGFGGILDEIISTSNWQYVRHGISDGFDFSTFPDITEDEVLERFDHAFNVIVESEDTA